MASNSPDSIGLGMSNMLRGFLGSSFIVEFGIVKAVPTDGIVTVEMSVADDADNIVITDCIYANLASSSVTLNMKPNIDDKVIVLFPRRFAGAMFQKANNEPIITECCNGYSVMGGIAIPLNQYQTATHLNFTDFSDGTLTMKLAYSENDSKNLFTLGVANNGNFTLTSNNTNVSITGDTVTVDNGGAVITVSSNGNITIDAKSGKFTIKNKNTDLKSVIKGLKDEVSSLTTTGSPSSQATSPTSKTSLNNWESSQLNKLFV